MSTTKEQKRETVGGTYLLDMGACERETAMSCIRWYAKQKGVSIVGGSKVGGRYRLKLKINFETEK